MLYYHSLHFCILLNNNFVTSFLYMKYKELKVNMECLHNETDSSMPIDEQLMFEATDDSNKSHVYGFGSQSSAINTEQLGSSSSSSLVLSLSSTVADNAYNEREKKLYGYMQQA